MLHIRGTCPHGAKVQSTKRDMAYYISKIVKDGSVFHRNIIQYCLEQTNIMSKKTPPERKGARRTPALFSCEARRESTSSCIGNVVHSVQIKTGRVSSSFYFYTSQPFSINHSTRNAFRPRMSCNPENFTFEKLIPIRLPPYNVL